MRAYHLIQKTIELQLIAKIATNRYQSKIDLRILTNKQVCDLYGIEFGFYSSGEQKYRLNIAKIENDLQLLNNRATTNQTQTQTQPAQLRKINRLGYHQGHRNVYEALNRISFDADGVKRAFGIEYEIYKLTAEQEDKLARLLDTLPSHVCERDGSLGENGIEIVFDPMSKSDFVKTINTLKEFVTTNNVQMKLDDETMAGCHVTYSIQNLNDSISVYRPRFQARLNRYAMLICAIASTPEIRRVFGRGFGRYRTCPNNVNAMEHSNAFSINGRSGNAWECRLPSWEMNPEAIAEFFKITESVYERPLMQEDIEKLFNLFERI